MTITIKLKTDNAAFDGDKWQEIRRILTELCRYVRLGAEFERAPLRDSNGNTVGSVTVRGK